jgi:hypothetical protein
MSASVHKNGAKCWARCSDFSPHATGFSQMTIFPERRIHSAKILEGASPDAPNFSAVR